MRGLSPVAASGGHSLLRPLLLRSTGSRCAGSVVVAHRPSCSTACGIFADQGSNPCPLHWQADSQPLRHQGSPTPSSFKCTFLLYLTMLILTNIMSYAKKIFKSIPNYFEISSWIKCYLISIICQETCTKLKNRQQFLYKKYMSTFYFQSMYFKY